jgi:hypothetical protein
MMSQVHVVKNSSMSEGDGSSTWTCGCSSSEAAAAVAAVLPPILQHPVPKIIIMSCDADAAADADADAASSRMDVSFSIPAASALANSSRLQTITFCPHRPGHGRHASLAALAAAAAKASADSGSNKVDAVILECSGGELAVAAAVLAWEMLKVDGTLLMVPRDAASVKVTLRFTPPFCS